MSRAVPRNSPYAPVVQPLHESKEGERSTMECYDCGNPAVYRVVQVNPSAGRTFDHTFCSACVAEQGSEMDGPEVTLLMDVRSRLEYLRGCLRAESISWGEMAELQGLAEHIEPGDVELLEPAGVPEEVAYDRALLDAYFREQSEDDTEAARHELAEAGPEVDNMVNQEDGAA